jgi:hypothetical protein
MGHRRATVLQARFGSDDFSRNDFSRNDFSRNDSPARLSNDSNHDFPAAVSCRRGSGAGLFAIGRCAGGAGKK